jgi:hypothetical protein
MGTKKATKRVRDTGRMTPTDRGLTSTELRWITQIREALSVDLLNQDMREAVAPTDHYCRGHCYVASEAFYHLYGKDAGFESRGADYHWWLYHPGRHVIADPTAPQLPPDFIYPAKAPSRFLPQSPSYAAEELMRRVKGRRARPRQRWR